MENTHWLDRFTAPVAPRWTLKRQRARMAADLLVRHYEAASVGRRTQGWRKSNGDANAVIGPALSVLRSAARDLVRNNPYAESALGTIADHTVGWGISAKPVGGDKRAQAAWDAWADSTDCDADGRHDIYGLQKLVMRSVAESGEILVRRRFRRPSDGFAVPLQLQVLDADFLDTAKDTLFAPVGINKIVQGVEYDAIGRRVAYWLFPEHPGAVSGGMPTSQRVPASEILHVFRPLRAGQARGPSWFAPVLLRFKDFDEFEDATLMKQKIAACLAVIMTDPDGSTTAVGTADPRFPDLDFLEPGAIKTAGPGQSVEVVQPPSAGDYDEYSKSVLRAIATGLGVTYEDLTGDYTDLSFSAARMSRLRHVSRINDWRYRILIPQFCNPVWGWFMQAAAIMNMVSDPSIKPRWTAPPLPAVDPDKEGLANQRDVRNGFRSWSEVVRESGQDPEEVAQELKSDFDRFDRLGLQLDVDPRKTTQAGQAQGSALSEPQPDPAPTAKTKD